jgi:adenylylsulfate kinase-like enzyme
MIYWFTGQPGAGKTVLAKALMKEFMLDYHIDGDDLRELTNNKNYGIKGRVENVETAQKIAHYLNNMGDDVVVSLVSPYLDQREEFKKMLGDEIVEFYVHTAELRGREQYHVEGYQPPKSKFIDIDTTKVSPKASLEHILSYVDYE